MAGWALGLSLVPTLITMVLAVVFASVVLRQARDGRDHGKGMAIAVLCIVPVWIAVGVAVVAISVFVAPPEDGAADDGTERSAVDTPSAKSNLVRWTELEPRDCFKEPRADETIYFLKKVPCGREAPQVFAVYQLDGPDKFPGNAATERRTENGCLRHYERYLERKPKEPQRPYAYFHPVEEAWKYGERTAICYLIRSGTDAPPTEQQPA